MLSFSLLPVSLLGLLVSQVFASPSTPYDPFHGIAVLVPRQPESPVCCLRPLEPAEPPTEEGLLLSFEDWKAKRVAEVKDPQPSAHASVSSGQKPRFAEVVPEPTGVPVSLLPSQADGATTSATPQEDNGVPYERSSPHFRIPLTDRFNYASLDCSARVHTAHRSAKSTSAILSDKKDRYMLSPCAEEKQFVVVELCEDIRIDTVQLANFEFFSGVFKDFTVSVAKTYTTDLDGWTNAGTYRARNVRGVQSFHPPTSLRDFYRFIRIDFHSHYGSEYYCPVSLLRVYGLTHMEQWKWDMWETESIAKRTAEEASAPSEVVAEPPQAVHVPVLEVIKPQDAIDERRSSAVAAATPTPALSVPVSSREEHATGAPVGSNIQDADPAIRFTEKAAQSPRRTSSMTGASTTIAPVDADGAGIPQAHVTTVTTNDDKYSQTPESTQAQDGHIYEDSLYDAHSGVMDSAPTDTSVPVPASTHAVSSISHSPEQPSNDMSSSVHSPSVSSVSTSSSSSLAVTVSTYPLPQPLSPIVTGGESIYRTIMNRLTMLEANTTLYARYVEEQTAGVREVLRRLTEDVGRLEGIGKAQAQMYQRSVQDFERHRRRLETEHVELLSKVNYLTDEVILEKRLGFAQLVLLLAVLVFMGLTRGSRGEGVHGRPRSMREWGRRTLSLSGDWVARLRTRSSTPPPSLPTNKAQEKPPATGAVEYTSRPLPATEEKPPAVQLRAFSSAHKPSPRPRTPISLHASSSRHNIFNRPVVHGGVHVSPSSALSRPQIQRSTSGHGLAGIGPLPRSAKRFARSAHLHEVKSTGGAQHNRRNVDVSPLVEKARRSESLPDASVDLFSPQPCSAVPETPSTGKSRHPDDRLALSPLRMPTADDLPHACSSARPLSEADNSEVDGWVDTDVDGSESELGSSR